MRILFVVTDLDLGGAEAQVVTLASGLAGRGHQVELVSLIDPVARTEQLGAAAVPWHSLGMKRGLPDPRGLLKLRSIIRRFRPDVVHAHMVHANLLARLTRLLTRMPRLITTAHNTIEGGRLLDLGYRLTDRLADLTTNVSDASVESFIKRGLSRPGRITAVVNGLDLQPFIEAGAGRAARRLELGLDSFSWLAIGRLVPEKDFGNLLAAHRRLPTGTRLLIVGSGPQLEQLQAQAGPGVEFLGRRDDIAGLMAAADGLVLSSLVEGLPMVLLEAAASRLPVVSTDVGGTSQIVRHKQTGLLVQSGDPEALARAMLLMMELPEEDRRRLADSAHEWVKANYGLASVLDRWEELYAAP